MFCYICVSLVILWTIYHVIIKPMNYWRDRGVPYIPSYPFVGNFLASSLGLTSFADDSLAQYNAFPDKSCYGIRLFGIQTLMLRDLDLLRAVMIKDFEYFTDHTDTFFKDDRDPLMAKNLFALKGHAWRDMRGTLSPAYTANKIKRMIPFIVKCADNLTDYYTEKITTTMNSSDLIELDFKDACTRFTNDVIATTAFGIDIDSFHNQRNIFLKMGKEATTFQNWRLVTLTVFPLIMKVLRINLLPSYIFNFFHGIVSATLKEREVNRIVRHDMLHLLMEARRGPLKRAEPIQTSSDRRKVDNNDNNNVTTETRDLSVDEITAQVFIFYFAGFETASALLCFSIYELAVNSHVQKQLQKEIDNTLQSCAGNITYEVLVKMKYLDMILWETLRKWPPVFSTDRMCTKEYVLPTAEKNIKLEPGMNVTIPIYGIQRDPKHFAEPDQFVPERFSDENKATTLPITFLAFGAGPRSCIGSRFVMIEAKIVLMSLLHKFDVLVTSKTPIPLKLKPKSPTLTADSGFWLGLRPRTPSTKLQS